MSTTLPLAGAAPAPSVVTWARWTVVLATLGLMVSPPVANLFQLVLYALFIGSPTLRARLWATRREPMVMGAVAFLAILAVAAFYSAAGLQAGLASLWNWRKLLMLPLAAALFQEPAWKLRFMRIFAVAATVAAALSIAFYLFQVAYPFGPAMQDGTPGIIVRNHATQGMVFGVAAFFAACFPLLGLSGTRRARLAWALALVILLGNIAFVTIGRSGYVVALAGAVTLAAGWSLSRGHGLLRTAGLGLLLLALVAGVLWATPKSRERILQGVHEIQTYAEATEVTSMGIRIYFWKTTPALIARKPLLGWGTGGFEAAYRQEVAGRSGNAGLVTSDPHNQYLKIMTEQGLLGFAVFVAFLASLLRQRPRREFRILGLGVLLAWCGTGLANAHFSTFAEGNLLYTWLGVLLATAGAQAASRPGPPAT